MLRRFFSVVTVVLFLRGLSLQVSLADPECTATKNGFQFSIRSARNGSGDWVTKVEGRRDIDNSTDNVTMDFKHRVVECGRRQILHYEGVFGVMDKEDEANKLFFHPRCGTNVAIKNNGRTLQKINGEERFHGVAYTSRPLRPNELFEVSVDARSGSKFGYFMGIGITTTTPHDGEIANHINAMKPQTWVMYHNNLYHNGQLILKSRPNNLDQLKVGDRVGLKRTDAGTLILVVNGKEDAVASNVPNTVYGAFECYGDVSQVTLTNSRI